MFSYLLCLLLSMSCGAHSHHEIKRARIPIIYSATDSTHYIPYVLVYTGRSRNTFQFALDTGSNSNIIGIHNVGMLLNVYPKDKLIRISGTQMQFTLGKTNIRINDVIYDPSDKDILNTLGLPFFNRQTSILFTEKDLYVNYFMKGIKHCIRFNGKSIGQGVYYTFPITVNGHEQNAIFDSGTTKPLLRTSLLPGIKIKKEFFAFYNGKRKVRVQIFHAKVKIMYTNRFAKMEGNNKDRDYMVINDPSVVAINKRNVLKNIHIKYIVGWPMIAIGGYYINNVLGQQCFIPKARLTTLLKSVH